MKLEKNTAVITGSSRGLGRAIAINFAKEGAKVVVNYPPIEEPPEEVIQIIRSAGGEAIDVKADIAKKEEAEFLIESCIKAFGSIDILVNNAGFTRPALLLDMEEKQWDEVVDVHLKGSFLCSQAAARYMKEQKKGKIINVTSVAGLTGTVGQVNYSAAKGGIISMTKSIARELARYNVCVNAVSLGVVATDMTEKIRGNEKLKEIYLNRILMKRFASPEDVVPGFTYLASSESDYITGHILCIDGGYGMT